MRRTVEVVLSLIGAFVYLIGAFFGGMFRMMDAEDELLQESLQEQQGQLTPEELEVSEMMLNGIGTFGTIIIVGAIISIIAGIVAMVFFKGNNKPKAASIILLVVGGITTIATLGIGLFASIFYIIAGIMGLVRKPKQEVNLEQY